MYKITLFFFALLVASSSKSQDAQFTAFDQHAIIANPSFTGDFGGAYDIKLGIQHRHQWNNALKGDEYNHTAISVESSNPFCVNGGQIVLSIGGYFKDERFLSIQHPSLVNTKAALTSAVRLGFGDKAYFSGGLEVGVLQRRLQQVNNLQFGVQFDGLGGFDNQLSSQEANLEGIDALNTPVKIDAGLGGSIVFSPDEKWVLVGGFAAHHVNNPDLNFLNENNNDRIQATRLTANLRVNWQPDMWKRNKFQFVAAYIRQGKSVWQSNLGLIAGHAFKDIDNNRHYFSIGGGVRVTNPVLTNDPITDIYGLLQYDFDRYAASVSVDLANSVFSNGINRNFGTTFELAFALLISKNSVRDRCNVIPCKWNNRSYNFRW